MLANEISIGMFEHRIEEMYNKERRIEKDEGGFQGEIPLGSWIIAEIHATSRS